MITSAEFLRSPECDSGKFELYDGVLIPITAATRNHERIIVNVISGLASRLAGHPCQPVGSGLKIVIDEATAYRPAAGVDSKPDEGDGKERTYGESMLVVEVDCGDDKVAGYMSAGIPYILFLSQDQMQAIFHAQLRAGMYLSTLFQRPEEVVHLDRIGVTLTLQEIYRRVTLSD